MSWFKKDKPKEPKPDEVWRSKSRRTCPFENIRRERDVRVLSVKGGWVLYRYEDGAAQFTDTMSDFLYSYFHE